MATVWTMAPKDGKPPLRPIRVCRKCKEPFVVSGRTEWRVHCYGCSPAPVQDVPRARQGYDYFAPRLLICVGCMDLLAIRFGAGRSTRRCDSCLAPRFANGRNKARRAYHERPLGYAEMRLRLMAEADASCGICGSTERLSLDHNHDTGAIRELLCRSCNIGIGLLADNAHRLRLAADYLDRHAGRVS